MNASPDVRIGEFCRVGSGSTPPRESADRYFRDGKIPWVKSGELREKVISDTEEHLTPAALEETSLKLIPAGALLLAMYGATVGRLGILGVPATTNQAVCHLIPDPKSAHVRYLFHALQSRVEQIVARGVGGAQPNISQGIVKDLVIPLPQLSEQRRIAAILDKADELRAKRRTALAQLKPLAQANFLDVFGDPIFNPHGWPRVTLEALCKTSDDIRCGPFGTQLAKAEVTTNGVPLWGIRQVNSLFEISPHEFVDLKTAKRLAQYSIEHGDIVMTRKGTVGNCAVYSDSTPGIMHSDLLRIRVDQERCEPVFLSHQLHYSRDVERQIVLISGGAVMPGINVTKLKNLEVLSPPIALQMKFVNRIAAMDKLKAAYSTSLIRLDALFSSLQHRAFRGEL